MSSFSELNNALVEAQLKYSEKLGELIEAQKHKEESEISLIRSDSKQKSLRLEVAVYKSQLDSLMEQSRNLRKEASL